MKSFATFAFLLLAVSAFSQQNQLGQYCHSNIGDSNFGLYCATLKTSFMPQQGTSYATSIEVIGGVVTPITGTLTLAPGQGVTPQVDAYDANGNPICWEYDNNGSPVRDSNGNPLVVACPVYASYDITDWDVTIGSAHFVHSATGRGTNSYCGNGYSNSMLSSSGNYVVYYLCGDNSTPQSMGMIALVIPMSYLEAGSNKQAYAALAPETQVTLGDGSTAFWDTGLYQTGLTPNASAVAAIGQASGKGKGKKK
jgi:hypothetical protein